MIIWQRLIFCCLRGIKVPNRSFRQYDHYGSVQSRVTCWLLNCTVIVVGYSIGNWRIKEASLKQHWPYMSCWLKINVISLVQRSLSNISWKDARKPVAIWQICMICSAKRPGRYSFHTTIMGIAKIWHANGKKTIWKQGWWAKCFVFLITTTRAVIIILNKAVSLNHASKFFFVVFHKHFNVLDTDKYTVFKNVLKLDICQTIEGFDSVFCKLC